MYMMANALPVNKGSVNMANLLSQNNFRSESAANRVVLAWALRGMEAVLTLLGFLQYASAKA